jgi:hypothetical protein
MIVDQHQPVVEKYYGPGRMTSVLRRLLQESDKVTKSLVEGWEEERSMKRKVRLCASNVVSELLTCVAFRDSRHLVSDSHDARLKSQDNFLCKQSKHRRRHC